jgi:hypothetical protein
MFRTLWNDETGFIISAELILLATILVIGLIVGMVSLRNQIVQELVDVGQAFGSLSQSYCFPGTIGVCFGVPFGWTDGSCYLDHIDFCQAPQPVGGPPGGLILAWGPGNPAPGPMVPQNTELP